MPADQTLDYIDERIAEALRIIRRELRVIATVTSGQTNENTTAIEQAIATLQAEATARRQVDQQVQFNLDNHRAVVATTSVLGHVKVDGTTITIADGVISSVGGGGGGPVPPPPDTYAYITGDGGEYLLGDNGEYLYVETP